MKLSLAPAAAGGAARDAGTPRPSVVSVPLLPLSRLSPKSNVIVAPRTSNGTLLSSRYARGWGGLSPVRLPLSSDEALGRAEMLPRSGGEGAT